MKYIKVLGLAAIAATALMAFVGASSASATVLCKSATSPCPAGEMYEPGTVIEGTSTNAELTSNLANVDCKDSHTTAVTTTTGGAAETVQGTITSLTFNECSTTQTPPLPCEVTVNNLPYHAEVHWTTGVNGQLTVESDGSGSPGASVVCAGVISCTFERALFTLPVAGGNPATISANKISLERTPFGGTPLCGTEAFWDATYTAVGVNTAIRVLKE